MRWARVGAVLGAVLAAVLLGAPAASAHPLGNFTVNTYSGLVLRPDGVRIDYVLDLAELPTFQLALTPADLPAWGRRTCEVVAGTMALRADGRGLPVTAGTATAAFRPGTAGLHTLRLECGLTAAADLTGVRRVGYGTTAYTDRVGWREVTAVGDRMTVRGDVPRESVSRRLTAYPADLLSSPLDVRRADLSVSPGGPALTRGDAASEAGAPARGVDALTRWFTDFVGTPQLTAGVGLLAVALSVLLGAAHAFAPGHGKTVMAAYLVGQRGSLRHAAVVAGTVTLTHTAGVLVLGAVLTTAVAVAPTRVYAWLGVASGMLLAGVGAGLLRRARGDHGHPHGHPHAHPHGHAHPHAHPHPHPHPQPDVHPHPDAPPIRKAGLIAMGFVGGLVPSPSAVVVLLGAVALGRTWFGVLLVAGYGVGMALTLAGLGYLLARWGGALERRGTGPVAARLGRALPVATASLVVLVGLVVAAQGGLVLASG
jgi:ABC-type nickel/cobalt efflux system permease component RcnA